MRAHHAPSAVRASGTDGAVVDQYRSQLYRSDGSPSVLVGSAAAAVGSGCTMARRRPGTSVRRRGGPRRVADRARCAARRRSLAFGAALRARAPREHRDGARCVSAARAARAGRDATEVRALRARVEPARSRSRARPAAAQRSRPARVTVSDGVAGLMASMRDPSVVPLGAAQSRARAVSDPHAQPAARRHRARHEHRRCRRTGLARPAHAAPPARAPLARLGHVARRGRLRDHLGRDGGDAPRAARHHAAGRQRGGVVADATSASCSCSKRWACA